MFRFHSLGVRFKLSLALLVSTLLAALVIATPAPAHEIRPAVADVTVTQTRVTMDITLTLEGLLAGIDLSEVEDTDAAPEAERYDALRALPAEALETRLRDAWPDLAQGLRLRAGAEPLDPRIALIEVPETGDLTVPRDSRLVIEATLPQGRAPVIFGWAPEYGPIVLRQITEGSDEGYTGYLTRGQDSAPIPRDAAGAEGGLTTFGRYVLIGFDHIVPKGLDHILFVLGLFFFSLKLRPLLYQVSAFTVAHTVTLALAILGLVRVPAAIVEPLIAASIAWIAVENILFKEMKPWRTAVVFGFGLLHGLGFASVLSDIGLNPARFVTGLIGFNVGVELGQIAVLAMAWGMLGIWFGKKPWWRARVAVPASLVIAATGAYWFVERLAA